MSILKSVMLVMSNVDGNNNKFWKAEIHADFSVHVMNGRVGSTGQVQPVKNFSSIEAAEKFLTSKQNEKEKKGYTLFKGITETGHVSGGTVKSATTQQLEAIAAREIRTKSDPKIVFDLVSKLAKANIHNILQHTDLKYDEGTGLFKTPIGFVTQETIDEARQLLIEIGDRVAVQDFTSEDIKTRVNKYLMLIPQKVGTKLTVQSVFPDQNSLVNHTSVLDGLQSSLQQLESMKQQSTDTPDIPVARTFNCELSLVSDKSVIDAIVAKYNETRQTMHAAHKLKVNRVFEVRIDNMENGFTQHGSTLGNIQQLWHGTRIGNVLSILKSGLFIPPSNASYVCGRMFGNGLYFSDQSTKSLNYAYGYWDGGKRDDTCYMFLFDVAMGKSYTPPHSTKDLPKPGYDSTFAMAGRSSVQNNEMIVYNTNQAAPRYLVEFTL